MKFRSKVTRRLFVGLILFSSPMFLGYAVAQTCVPAPADMVSWWDGDAVSGTTVSDIQDGNDGTLVNDATTAPGIVGDAFSFDGINGFIEIPDSASLQPATEITVDAWVKVDSIPDGVSVHIIDRHGSAEGLFEGYLLWADNVTGFGSSVWTVDNGQVTVTGGPTNIVGDGTFHHVSMTYDGANVKMYVDGIQVDSVSATGPIKYAATLNLNLGRNQQPSAFSRRFDGLLDEVEIFDRALSAEEIQSIVDAGSAGKCKGGTVPFDTFSIDKARVKLGDEPDQSEFEVEGSFVLADPPTGDGFIDPLNEKVTVTFGELPPEEIRAGYFLPDTDDFNIVEGFQFDGPNGGLIRVVFTIVSTNIWDFKIIAKDVDLSVFNTPTPFSFQIGNDIGTFDIPFDEKGEYRP